ncbi:TonB-dependent receptor [Candidatus Colwellia aromaticivorans]|uniref:TonB-dependent receptor n=1 Tax=Candidatus Colwellia aromaticivorans TaxID=2267621 RepID=UPI000DF47009|nr:TonB-dependent receptor [Candidatus Colwellia aromaticivorans]
MPYNKVFTACTLCLSISAFSYTSAVFSQNISGKIVNQQNKPISGALVEINGNQQKVITNEQGLFTISNLTAGKIELHTSAKNYAHKNQYITINQDDISGLNIRLSPSVMEVFDVYATPLHTSTIESALPVNVIAGDELKLKQASTLGETLKNEVGVHSSFYGSVASSPIIRGLDGPRVLITQNGLDAGDASRVGADHAVASETSTATQIEVLRGPATLFYGSGAIGGVVNIVDNRVPTSTDMLGEWLLQYNDVANEKQGSFSIQTGNDSVAVHLDGFWRDASDYQLPKGFEVPEEEHEEHEEEQGSHLVTNSLSNSASKSSGFTLGSSVLFDQGFIGFSYGKIKRDYGIPGHDHHEEEHEEEGNDLGTAAEMKQDRLQVLSEVNFSTGFIKQLITRFAYTDYQHQEIEDGLVGTTFSNESFEMKVDLHHQEYLGWQGAWTLHFKNSDFKAIGEEAFAPPSNTDSFAIAWLEEKHFGDLLLQLGARIERVTIDANDTTIGFPDHDHAHDDEQVSFVQQNFNPFSTSLGLVWDYQAGYNLGLSLAVSQRAPSAAELFSFGPHIGTGTFEVGAMFELSQEDDEIHVELSPQDIEVETSYSVDLTWRKFEGDFGFVASAFYNHVKDYYYQQDTGLQFKDEHADEHDEEGLPILIYQQGDVNMYGLEAEFVYQISNPIKVKIFGDYIKAELASSGESIGSEKNSSLPRIPPMRIGASLNYQGNSFDSEISANHYFKQNDIASLETSTAAYSLIDFNYNYYLDGMSFRDSDMVLYIKGNNLTDEVAHVHSSFLKEFAPLPGRNFSIGVRGSF